MSLGSWGQPVGATMVVTLQTEGVAYDKVAVRGGRRFPSDQTI